MPIDARPLAADLWIGIAGHFDSITQVLCEFVDNCISNFEAKRIPPKSIQISVWEDPHEVHFQIEDTGTGITDFAPVLRLGDKTTRQTPLNEHGFGLKHALASANPNNDRWCLYTRTAADYQNGCYRKLSAPYDFVNMEPATIRAGGNPWPGIFNGPGTIVEFACSKAFFNTIQRGIRGQAGFQRCLDYLTEELGYVYSGIIRKGKATITVSANAVAYNRTVEAVSPTFVGFYQPDPGQQTIDLAGSPVFVEYAFGEMQESNHVKHYKKNQSTSGVEIRINGRLIMANIFKDIWLLEPHPQYNHFLATINLVSDRREFLPHTRTSKNGIRSGDVKLEALYTWIRNTHPSPHKDLANAQSERDLVTQLEKIKNEQTRDPAKHIEREFKVFTTLESPVSVDLYFFDGREVVLYEAKKDCADIQNVYQLLMYWDGAVEDGKTPAEGILLASEFSPGVDAIIEMLNARQDKTGNRYNFRKKTWREESVPYP